MPVGTETILLVEYERMVRILAQEILEECGYKILAAEDGIAALAISEQVDGIDLLLTDVVMPKMGGVSWQNN